MRSGIARLFALACVPVLMAGCKADRPLEPAAEEVALAASHAASLGAPSGLTSAAVSKSQIDVTWRDNASNEAGFEVYRSATGPTGSFAVIGTTGSNVISFGDLGLSPTTEYCYRVRAYAKTGAKTSYSAFSNVGCATTPSPPTPPPPPPPPPPPALPAASNASARPSNSSSISVTWTDNSTTEDGFRVERAPSAAGPWEVVQTDGANVTSFYEGYRTSEQTMCYRVVAFNVQGDATPSNTACTVPPAAPTNLVATPGALRTIDLTWDDKSAFEDGYQVLRSWNGLSFALAADLAANTRSYADTSLQGNTRYWYRVLAKKDGGSSDLSNTAIATTIAPPGASCPVYEIDCGNSVDDDCDGLADRADPDCQCLPELEGACFNGRDDDCDGLVDAGDPDCQLQPCGADECGYGYLCFADFYCHSHCEDGAPDYDESASDCGGSDCPRCTGGQQCNNGFDCASGICANNICQP